ncbi:hypothetical protein OH77DRAFT_122911 [Trametes cingulata]|nr:hypothetical protein OH77DRAFT_122911 [Trametes cingulata]
MLSLERITHALRVSRLVAAEVPVRGLSTALETALSILHLAKELTLVNIESFTSESLMSGQDAKGAGYECSLLAQRAASMSAGIYDHLKHVAGYREHDVAATEETHPTLALKRDMVMDEVKELLVRLEDAMCLFTVPAAMEFIKEDAQDIDAKCSRILPRVTLTETSDGTLHYFAREDFALRRCHLHAALLDTDDNGQVPLLGHR